MKFEQIEHYDHFDTETIFWADITDMPETIQNKAREIDGAGYDPLRFGVARTVYMYLKDHADGEGKCWPGIRTISSELRLSRSTVKRALDETIIVQQYLLQEDYPNNRIEIIDAAFFSTELRMKPARSQA